MKSIRLSLIVYFLVLLALALGAVSLVVYQTSAQALGAREKRTRALYHERYQARREAEKEKLDRAVLAKVKSLATVAQAPPWGRRARVVRANPEQVAQLVGMATAGTQGQGPVVASANLVRIFGGPHRNFSINFIPSPLYALGQLSAAAAPPNLLLGPAWWTDLPQSRWVALQLYQPAGYTIQFDEELLPGGEEGQASDYCQVCYESGESAQRSPSLGEDDLKLDLVRAAKIPEGGTEFDTVSLRPGVTLRRVTYKAALPPFVRFVYTRRPQGPRPPGRPRGDRSRGRPQDAPANEGPKPSGWAHNDPGLSVFYIQYARDTRHLDAALAQLQEDHTKDVVRLEADTEETLASLRLHLAWISMATFAATVLGGFWLVRIGLSPLRRLGEAVSKVSTKDFRLPVEEGTLPRELRPIVHRLSETLNMLKRAFAREKQAAADISHELRTPLAALLTTIEVALRKPRSPEDYREVLQDCRESGKQMTQLVERLLALARLDAGVDTLRPRETDVAGLAEQCAALVRPLAEARGVALHVHCDGPAPLTADPDKLREVLTNLLHNAIQYNRPDGAIDLRVERNNGSLWIEVRDTGIGIPAAAREHIFERFYRADPSRHADDLHAGLGLAIVKGYVDLMGGTIAVESVEGQGSTFRVQLPAPTPAPAGPRERVLAG